MLPLCIHWNDAIAQASSVGMMQQDIVWSVRDDRPPPFLQCKFSQDDMVENDNVHLARFGNERWDILSSMMHHFNFSWEPANHLCSSVAQLYYALCTSTQSRQFLNLVNLKLSPNLAPFLPSWKVILNNIPRCILLLGELMKQDWTSLFWKMPSYLW